MRKKLFSIVAVISLAFILASHSQAYDNKVTHKDLTEKAIEYSHFNDYAPQKMGMPAGSKEVVRGRDISYWLSHGSYLEDTPNCRASNHFHNPLLPWDQSYMTDQPIWVDLLCFDWKPWYSNITWATGYLASPPTGQKASFSTLSENSPITWDRARDYYYKALTLTTKDDRDIYFTWALEAVGRVMHLLADVAVPAHVRNDFTSHLIINEGTLNPFKRYIQQYERYVQANPLLVTNAVLTDEDSPSFYSTKLTDFWDSDTYNGSNPSTLNDIGLSEFTNANYFSDFTIPSNGPTPDHAFPYPRISGSNVSGPNYHICVDYVQGSLVKRKYISRKNKGDCPQLSEARSADHFAVASLLNREILITDNYISSLRLWLDNNVHKTYAAELIPRAVGYSAALLDYFFRGSVELSLPDTGAYAETSPDKDFTKLTVLARNTTSTGENMDDGTIELVVIYRLAYDDPFKNYPESYDFQAANEYSYIVVPEAGGIRSIPRDGPVELTFDLSGSLLPLYAIDVNLQLVYHGRLGMEDGAVVVGLKDISEPTPIDMMNDTDLVCLNGSFYESGSQGAIDQVDSNQDGIPEWDIYPHNLENVYGKISPTANPAYASSADYDFVVRADEPGQLVRAFYILTDRNFTYSFNPTWVNTDPLDSWIPQPAPVSIYSGTAITDQTYYVDDAASCAPGKAPCHIWKYPAFFTYRNNEMWGSGGVIFIKNAYPEGTECQCYTGITSSCTAQKLAAARPDTHPFGIVLQKPGKSIRRRSAYKVPVLVKSPVSH